MNRSSRAVIASVAASIMLTLVGCSGQVSNAGVATPTAERIVYPITPEEADGALSRAMVATFPDTPISPVSLPNKGYTTTIRLLLDSHQITATAIPGVGVAATGERMNGYAFAVSHAGTMPLSASNRSSALFAAINREATAIRAPLPAAAN